MTGDKEIETAWIGPGRGESGPIASLRVSRNRRRRAVCEAAGPGSKKLKGLVVRGTQWIKSMIPAPACNLLMDLGGSFRRTARTKYFQAQGVPCVWEPYNRFGGELFPQWPANVVPPGPYELLLLRIPEHSGGIPFLL